MDHLLDNDLALSFASTYYETALILLSVISPAFLYVGLLLVASPFINYLAMRIWNHFLSWHWHRVNNHNNNYITAPCSCGSATVGLIDTTDGDSDYDGPSCWICLGHGPDCLGKPLR